MASAIATAGIAPNDKESAVHDHPPTSHFPSALVMLVALLACAFAARGTDTYGPAADELQIPALRIGSATYTGVVLTIGSIVSAPNGTTAKGTEDTYNPENNQLTVPAVLVGSTTYYNAVGTVASLRSIQSVAGADTFDGTHLKIPYVLVGDSPYYNVVLSVSTANVTGVHGGMPTLSADQYNSATGVLQIPAVQVGATVYTNVTLHVTLGNVASVGISESVLYSFGTTGGDGANPHGSLMQAADGNFYGMTYAGGAGTLGAVVRISASGSESVVYSFPQDAAYGAVPRANLIQGSDGNFYGMTLYGGTNNAGVAFQLTPGGAETVLHSFGSAADAAAPRGSLLQGSDGNFYGMSYAGGTYGYGAIFRITASGESVLHSFNKGTGDGYEPNGNLIQASDGNFYGVTAYGGTYGVGAVIKLTAGGSESVLYSFGTNPGDGAYPTGSLIQASDGNLYAMTYEGGAYNLGTVFKVSLGGAESVLYSFGASAGDGTNPFDNLLEAADGNFYGMTEFGGASNDGAIMRVTPAGAASVLHSFGPGGDGETPYGSLIQATDGNIYGMTPFGGAAGNGAVIRLNW